MNELSLRGVSKRFGVATAVDDVRAVEKLEAQRAAELRGDSPAREPEASGT